MAPSRSQGSFLTLLVATSLFPSLSLAAFDCKEIVAKGVRFDFGKLAGPHIVHWQEEDLDHDLLHKYNFTLDVCSKLKWHKGGSEATECQHGTQVCAIRETINLATEGNSTITPINIAGSYGSNVKRPLDEKFELLRDSTSNSDASREGVRAILHGGRLPMNDRKDGIDQRAIIEFVCDKDRTGLGGDEKDGGDHEDDKDDDNKDGKKEEKEERLRRREESKKGKCEDNDHDLRFCGYEQEKDGKDKTYKTLRLEWRTKYACEDAPPADTESHWGFFGWFFIILFLAIAAYLIFGSWLNYNRYGARGWDLLPHGDTIRDIPYIAKDFARKVVGTVQGGGSRGGYAAV